MSLTYPVVLHQSDEGYAVNCPALPGCWSQGATEEEAVENIRDAIREYLAAIKETAPSEAIREIGCSRLGSAAFAASTAQASTVRA